MRDYIYQFRRRILVLLAVMGPGLITAFADNDAGGVATYSVAAAQYGYAMLFTLIPITIILMITQEIGARLAIVGGKGLADLIREQFGVRVAIVMFILLFIVNFGVILQNLGGLKEGLILFHLDYRIFLPALVVLLFIFITLSSYSRIQRFFLVLIVFYLAYVASAVLAKPDWSLMTKALVVPTGTLSFGYFFTAIAVLGTTVTAWGQFFINSFVKDKKLTTEKLKYEQLEVYVGALLTDIVTFFIMVAVIATIYVNNLSIDGAADAALAIRPFAGGLASMLFGVGLLIAGFLGCAIVPLATAYACSEFFGYEGSLDTDFKRSRLFYGFFLVQILLGLCVILLPGLSLFRITLIADFMNGVMLPVVFFFLYRLANNKEILGKYTNSKLQNILLLGSSVIICFGVLVGLGGKLFNL